MNTITFFDRMSSLIPKKQMFYMPFYMPPNRQILAYYKDGLFFEGKITCEEYITMPHFLEQWE